MLKLLFSKKYERPFVWNEQGDFCSDSGVIKNDVLLNAKPGEILLTNKSVEFKIIDGTFADQYTRLKRLAQVINPKDAGQIISVVGNDYKRVIDCGVGSAGLTVFLAKMNPKAKIFAIDNRDDHIEHSKKNVELFDLKNVEFIKADIYEDVPVNKIDLFILDVPEPFKVVPHFVKTLSHGAYIVSYSPCTNQVLDFVNALSEDFMLIKVVEIQERFWDVGGRVIRPSSIGAQHTGFLTFVRYL
jgi:tRNA (adenine57-N1/adenine58-N1)-methyltransferase catalytic subunit